MPFVNVLIHFVWATKNRVPILKEDIRLKIFKHIKQKSIENKIFIDCINGHDDHVHCLVSLGRSQTISKVIGMIKGEAAHWINENKLCKTKLEWQDEYYCASVSPTQKEIVRKYIHNQVEHHRKMTFGEEYQAFMKAWGFEKFNDNDQ